VVLVKQEGRRQLEGATLSGGTMSTRGAALAGRRGDAEWRGSAGLRDDVERRGGVEWRCGVGLRGCAGRRGDTEWRDGASRRSSAEWRGGAGLKG
jgi:hypothetical protein